MSNNNSLPFHLFDRSSGKLILESGMDLDKVDSDRITARKFQPRDTWLLDFFPEERLENGIYHYDLDCTDARSVPTDISATGVPFTGEYKTAAFKDTCQSAAPDSIVFDLGCGNCEILAKFPHESLRIGIDISANQMFRKTPNALDSGVKHLWVCDACNLPVCDNVGDVVLCCDILEHMIAPERLLAEAWRILRPGGILVVTVPNLVHIGNRISSFLGIGVGLELAQILKGKSPFVPISGPRFPDQRLHLRWFTSRSLVTFVTSCGFSVARTFGCGPVVTRLALNSLAPSTALLTGLIATKRENKT